MKLQNVTETKVKCEVNMRLNIQVSQGLKLVVVANSIFNS